MTDELTTLKDSVARLRRIVEPLSAEQRLQPAYPSEWTIADVMSHIGSSAIFLRELLDAALDGREVPADFMPPIWDTWNAKSPEAKTADGLAEDRALVERAEQLTDDERARVHVELGPLQLDFAHWLLTRLNEQALHTWDIEVALDPGATLPAESAGLVVDNLALIVQYTGRPAESARTLHVRTTAPARDFELVLAPTVTLTPSGAAGDPDLELPAEALVRLAYGRLDPAHTPAMRGDVDVDALRRAFPGP
jgi:uncharacterized protein (TIGR03083 family)